MSEVFSNSFNFNTTNYYADHERNYKTIEGKKYIKFYNPISSLAGDMTPCPIGTYYYNTQTTSQAWKIFDQALISYPLSKYLRKNSIKILDKIGNKKLLTSYGIPNRTISDHMPITISFV